MSLGLRDAEFRHISENNNLKKIMEQLPNSSELNNYFDRPEVFRWIYLFDDGKKDLQIIVVEVTNVDIFFF